MKKKALKRTGRKVTARSHRYFGTQEMALLAAVTVLLLILFAWQTNSLPAFLKF